MKNNERSIRTLAGTFMVFLVIGYAATGVHSLYPGVPGWAAFCAASLLMHLGVHLRG